MTDLRPDVIEKLGETADSWIGSDPARYTVFLTQFERPRLAIPGGDEFVWPLGTEGFRRSGSAALGIHKYFDDNAVVVQVLHRDEARIEMNGLFPGKTSTGNMNALEDILVQGSEQGKLLTLPGIFPNVQRVHAESWDFAHEEGDWTNSISYNVTFVRVGVNQKVTRPKITLPPPNPTTRTAKGKSGRVFAIRDNVRTLRAVAKVKYGNSNSWSKLYNLNKSSLTKFMKKQGISFHQLPTRQLPIGMKLYY